MMLVFNFAWFITILFINASIVGLGQKVKTFFSEFGYVAYQIKGKEV